MSHWRRVFMGASAILLLAFPASAETLPACTITFDSTCPDATPVCGARFVGGQGCEAAEFDADVERVDLFLASRTCCGGTMRFFDANGAEVGTPIRSDHCRSGRPPAQAATFDVGVRSIEIEAVGEAVWVDELRVNDGGAVSVEFDSMSTVKARFGG